MQKEIKSLTWHPNNAIRIWFWTLPKGLHFSQSIACNCIGISTSAFGNHRLFLSLRTFQSFRHPPLHIFPFLFSLFFLIFYLLALFCRCLLFSSSPFHWFWFDSHALNWNSPLLYFFSEICSLFCNLEFLSFFLSLFTSNGQCDWAHFILCDLHGKKKSIFLWNFTIWVFVSGEKYEKGISMQCCGGRRGPRFGSSLFQAAS